MKEDTKSIGKIFPPPLFVIVLSIIGFGLQWLYPFSFQFSFRPYWLTVGVILIVFSGLLAFLARKIMRGQMTPISFNKPTVIILSNGPFAYTRNPLYLSLVILYTGIGIVANSIWFTPLLIVVILFLNKVILREEKYLEQSFGKEYLRYKKTVRRWV